MNRKPVIQRAAVSYYPEIRELLAESSELYPGIEEWWDRRVQPGLSNGSRLCYIGTIENQLAAISICKPSDHSAKFCTLRVHPSYQNTGIGDQLFRHTIQQFLQLGCPSIHYTLNEGIVHSCGGFFNRYKFNLSSWKTSQYVKGIDELCYSVTAPEVRHTLASLPGPDVDTALISIRPQFADLLEQGKKRVEFRKSFSRRFISGRVIFYVTSPIKQIRLIGYIVKVVRDNVNSLWDQFGTQSGVTESIYNSYFNGDKCGVALVLDKVRLISNPLSLEESRNIGFSPPMSYKVLKSKDPLINLVVD